MQTYKIDILEDVTRHKVIWCKYLSSSVCTAVERTPQMDSGFWGSHFLRRTSTSSISWLRRSNGFLWVLHAYPHRAGNYTSPLSKIALLISITIKLLVLFQHHLIACDSLPRSLFQFSRP